MARSSFSSRSMTRYVRTLKVIGIIIACLSSFSASAQEAIDAGCATTKDCAQQIVEIAKELKSENEMLNKRINDLETALANATAQLRQETIDSFAVQRAKPELTYVNNGGNGQSELCPQGQYMVGVKWLNTSGGPNGIMAWLAPICRQL